MLRPYGDGYGTDKTEPFVTILTPFLPLVTISDYWSTE